jgi:site-specific DNA-methyltransferase (adenine-specific)
MAELPDSSVHLMVTSLPYNVGKEYDQDLTLEEYLAFLLRVRREVHRVLVPGGRACINVANLGRKPYIPLHAFIFQDMLQAGFLMRGEITWNKAASASPSTAWGSWRSASNPTLRDVHEYILIFSKGVFRRKTPGGEGGHHQPGTVPGVEQERVELPGRICPEGGSPRAIPGRAALPPDPALHLRRGGGA